MQRLPQDELRTSFSFTQSNELLDNQTALRLKKRMAEEFRNQLTFGVPTNADEAGLRRLSSQLKTGKLVVKLFLRHTLHAKLYLLFRSDPINPIIGYLGSSNLTLSGLSHQGELNVDVLDHDAANKLVQWFEARWSDRWCIDITAELIQVIDESWAREEMLPPYQIYVKMAYHLAQEARAGLAEFRIPPEFGNRLFDYQVAAVKIAAHHLNKRGGVLISASSTTKNIRTNPRSSARSASGLPTARRSEDRHVLECRSRTPTARQGRFAHLVRRGTRVGSAPHRAADHGRRFRPHASGTRPEARHGGVPMPYAGWRAVRR